MMTFIRARVGTRLHLVPDIPTGLTCYHIKKFLKILKYLIISISILIVLALIVIFARPMWRYAVTYPRFDKSVRELAKLRKEPPKISKYNIYRGALHMHTYWSHDSEGTLYDIIPAAKKNQIDFIFLSDHPHKGLDTFPRGYKGLYDGVLIEPGSEQGGFDAWPLKDAVINWRGNIDTIAKTIIRDGGMMFYAHPEEPHNWDSPYYQGMEIYNIHTDILDEPSYLPFLINAVINMKKYRPWVIREIFDEQVDILARWDSLNTHRKVTGFSAVDSHENVNIRAKMLSDGRIQWYGPNAKPIDTARVTVWNRWLLTEPDENGWVCKMMFDTYDSNFNYVSNFVFSDSLTVTSLSKHLIKGNHFTAFTDLGDARGFCYYAKDVDGAVIGIMGDSLKISHTASLHAVSPFPGQFRLMHNGRLVHNSSEDDYAFEWKKPVQKGAYRLEVHLKIRGKYIPWVYTNPIYFE